MWRHGETPYYPTPFKRTRIVRSPVDVNFLNFAQVLSTINGVDVLNRDRQTPNKLDSSKRFGVRRLCLGAWLGLQIPVRPAAPATFVLLPPERSGESEAWSLENYHRNWKNTPNNPILRSDQIFSFLRLLGSPFGETSISCRKGDLWQSKICWYQILSTLYNLHYTNICVRLVRVGGRKKRKKKKAALNRGSDLSPCVRNAEIRYIWKLSNKK